MPYRIIASDLDGTLLGADYTVSKENWEAIARMGERGVWFVPASGRAYGEMPAELLESPLIRYYITSDGATVYDKQTDTTYELPMPRELGWQVLDKLYQYPVCLMVHADTRAYVEAATHDPADYAAFHMSPYWVDFAMDKETPVADLKRFIYGLPALQSVVAFFKNEEDLNACRAYFETFPTLIVAQTDSHNLEIFSATAGKGNALLLLAELLSVERAETIAVGDSTNDYTMLQAAGLGLAMANAVPELKAVADAVICDYRDHGMKYILEQYIG